MTDSKAEKNKTIVLEAFDTLFNKRDYLAAERFWSPDYIQHSAHIEPGRDGLFNLVKSQPPTLKYEPGVIVAEGDFVIIHGRFSDFGLPLNWIAADIIRMQDGILIEHWDVIQDEATDTFIEVLLWLSDMAARSSPKSTSCQPSRLLCRSSVKA
jgi:predicted SnoaL-like aldol condensation-catalyzing enzyme